MMMPPSEPMSQSELLTNLPTSPTFLASCPYPSLGLETRCATFSPCLVLHPGNVAEILSLSPLRFLLLISSQGKTEPASEIDIQVLWDLLLLVSSLSLQPGWYHSGSHKLSVPPPTPSHGEAALSPKKPCQCPHCLPPKGNESTPL